MKRKLYSVPQRSALASSFTSHASVAHETELGVVPMFNAAAQSVRS